DAMADWLIFKLAEGASGGGELDASVLASLDGLVGAAERAARKALHGAKIELSTGETGVRLADPTMDALQHAAAAVEKVVEPVGIAHVATNESWDRSDFARVRAPLG